MLERDLKHRLAWKLIENRTVNAETNCWEWSRGKHKNGYPLIWVKEFRKNLLVARISAYIWFDFYLFDECY